MIIFGLACFEKPRLRIRNVNRIHVPRSIPNSHFRGTLLHCIEDHDVRLDFFPFVRVSYRDRYGTRGILYGFSTCNIGKEEVLCNKNAAGKCTYPYDYSCAHILLAG